MEYARPSRQSQEAAGSVTRLLSPVEEPRTRPGHGRTVHKACTKSQEGYLHYGNTPTGTHIHSYRQERDKHLDRKMGRRSNSKRRSTREVIQAKKRSAPPVSKERRMCTRHLPAPSDGRRLTAVSTASRALREAVRGGISGQRGVSYRLTLGKGGKAAMGRRGTVTAPTGHA